MINEAVYCQMRRLLHNCWSSGHPCNNKDNYLWLRVAPPASALQSFTAWEQKQHQGPCRAARLSWWAHPAQSFGFTNWSQHHHPLFNLKRSNKQKRLSTAMHLLTQTMHWSGSGTVINILPFLSEPFLEVFPHLNQCIPCCSVRFVECIYWLKEKHQALALKYKVTGAMDNIRREEKQPISPGIPLTAIKSSPWHLFILVRYCYWGGSHVLFHAKFSVQQHHRAWLGGKPGNITWMLGLGKAGDATEELLGCLSCSE